MYVVVNTELHNEGAATKDQVMHDAAAPYAVVEIRVYINRVVARYDNSRYAARKASELNNGAGCTTTGIR